MKLHVRTAVLAASFVAMAAAAFAQPADTLLGLPDFQAQAQVSGLVGNGSFLPSAEAGPAAAPFQGTISLTEAEMSTDPAAFKSRDVLGKDPVLFPAVKLSFATAGEDLVPATQDIMRHGAAAGGRSFWDMIVQPGRIWSEPGDDGWSRASFPFSLMHSIEGETHNGVAMFMYKGDEVIGLRFQVLMQTSPFYVEDYFTAWGRLDATFAPGAIPDEAAVLERHRLSTAEAEKIGTWAELEAKVGATALEGFNSDIRPGETVVAGLGTADGFYLQGCPTPAGELPYCDRQRFGVWSVTKATANAVGMLRLAEKFGPEVFDAKIADYITEAKDIAGWENVTFGDTLNMATGMGYGKQEAEPYNITDPFEENYYAWYEAPTVDGKLAALLKGAKPYPWGPGKVARYRDEDMFLIGVAMTRYMKAQDAPYRDIWELVQEEVYKPIGIHYAPINRTIEADRADDHPLMAFGHYPTISDLVKIARLFQHGGKHGDAQLLNAEKLADILPAAEPVGLPTGTAFKPYYRKAFWRGQMTSDDGCAVNYPMMLGWGSNFVPLFPDDVFAIRLAKNWDGDDGAGTLDSLEKVADRIGNFCP
jgi:hypothetical protein